LMALQRFMSAYIFVRHGEWLVFSMDLFMSFQVNISDE